MRWLVVEDSLENRKGHWFEYLAAFHRELPRMGDTVNWLIPKNAEPEVRDYFDALAVLPESAFKRMSDGASAWRRYARIPAHAWNTFWAVRRHLKPLPDAIFVPTVIVHHLLGWYWLIKYRLRHQPVTVLLFFPGLPICLQDSTALLDGSPTARLMRYLLRRLAVEIRTGKVVLGVETEAMRRAGEHVFGVPFTYLPHPVQSGPSDLSPSAALGRPSSLTMACYGPARYEKGSDVLVAAIEQYLQRHPGSRVRFIVQWLDDFPLPDGKMATLPPTLRQHPQVEVINRFFAEGEYVRWLARTDVLLLPYRQSSYGLRVSRVIIEALVNGMPAIVTSKTTLAEQAEQFGAAVLCRDGDVESFVQAIHHVEQNFQSMKNLSERQKASACNHFSVAKFRLSMSRHAGVPAFDLRFQLNLPEGRPKVLIVALEIWPGIARLPKALHESGFDVGVLCHQESPLAFTRYVDHLFLSRSKRSGGRIFQQLMEIIQNWGPAMIIPGDDRTVLFFQRMIQLHLEGKRTLDAKVLAILRLSFGNFDWLAEATSKRLTLEQAQKLGLKTPQFAGANSPEEAVNRAKELGWPSILKKSTAWGGGGVMFCENEQQVATTYRKFSQGARLKGKLLARLAQARGWRLEPKWFPADHSVTISKVIEGKPAMIAVTAVKGQILAHVSALAEKCHPEPQGPSSVIRFIEHPGILQIAEKMVGHWGATGLLGFDFMMSSDGEAYLIECNPRPICLTGMGTISGSDLCLTLHHHLAGLEIPASTTPLRELVAHFPSEWHRDSNSVYLRDAYHDVPWDDPELFHKLVLDCV